MTEGRGGRRCGGRLRRPQRRLLLLVAVASGAAGCSGPSAPRSSNPPPTQATARSAAPGSVFAVTSDRRSFQWLRTAQIPFVTAPWAVVGTDLVGETVAQDGTFRLQAWDVRSGAERWSAMLQDGERVQTLEAVGRDMIARTDLGIAPCHGASKDGSRVVSIDAVTGNVVWARNTGPVTASAAIDLGVVVIADRSGVVGVDAATGHLRWSHGVDGLPLAMVANAGEVTLLADTGTATFIDAASGVVEALIETPQFVDVTTIVCGQTLVAWGYLLSGGLATAVSIALDRRRVRWRLPSDFVDAVIAIPGGGCDFLDSDVVGASRLRRISSSTGATVWSYTLPQRRSVRDVAVSGGAVVVFDQQAPDDSSTPVDSTAQRIALDTGSPEATHSDTGGFVDTAVAVPAGDVCVGLEGEPAANALPSVGCIDADGVSTGVLAIPHGRFVVALLGGPPLIGVAAGS